MSGFVFSNLGPGVLYLVSVSPGPVQTNVDGLRPADAGHCGLGS